MTGEVSARARELAVQLSALFVADSQIAGRLNDTQRRLGDANDRLWSRLAPDALGLIYDGAAAGRREPDRQADRRRAPCR